MREWDFSNWQSPYEPELEAWLHKNLNVLMNEFADGSWRCWLDDVGKLYWNCEADGDNFDEHALVSLDAEAFKAAVLFRLTQDYPTDNGTIHPNHREDILEQWHRMRAAWRGALDEIDRAVIAVLELPNR